MKKFAIIISIFCLMVPSLSFGAANKLAGRILLQVESKGEAWYVSPKDSRRYFLGRPADALEIMRNQGIGITEQDIKKIPIGLAVSLSVDSDEDGLSDGLENAIGTNSKNEDSDNDSYMDYIEIEKGFDPMGIGRMDYKISYARAQKGKILLQVQRHGEAWYVDPISLKRYYLGRPADAYIIMSKLGLGISNKDLYSITPASTYSDKSESSGQIDISDLEKLAFDKVNNERTKNGLSALKLNTAISDIAREHSKNLADENASFSGLDRSCSFAMIHHEGLKFGLYGDDRLKSRGVKYFSMTGENIALMSGLQITYTYRYGDPIEYEIKSCHNNQTEMKSEFDQALAAASNDDEKAAVVRDEITKRTAAYNKLNTIKYNVNWFTAEMVAENAVQGWMNSPGHRANILNNDFDEAGMGVAYINGYFILTQEFIKRADCGYEDGPCCRKEGYYPYCYVGYECRNDICTKN